YVCLASYNTTLASSAAARRFSAALRVCLPAWRNSSTMRSRSSTSYLSSSAVRHESSDVIRSCSAPPRRASVEARQASAIARQYSAARRAASAFWASSSRLPGLGFEADGFLRFILVPTLILLLTQRLCRCFNTGNLRRNLLTTRQNTAANTYHRAYWRSRRTGGNASTLFRRCFHYCSYSKALLCVVGRSTSSMSARRAA